MGNNIFVGTICEISKAYNSETGQRDLMDEVACTQCEVLKLNPIDGSADVYVKALGEFNVTLGRLKRIR